jgi:adenosylcobinamide-phosphate synthase
LRPVVTGHPLGAAVGLTLDWLLGEPPAGAHPVAWFGSLMGRVESRLWRDDRGAGAVYAALGTGAGVVAGALTGSSAAATWISVSGRMLGDTARTIDRALQHGDVAGARSLLPALVGRDPAGLDEPEIVRAVVESVAENTVDAVVAPVLWAAVFGAPGALGYRAVNTLDSMVGHRSVRYERFGWASARLDDAAGYAPARLTAALVAAVRPRLARRIWRTVRRESPPHPSPNAGVAEAAFAAALGVRLGGRNAYGDRVEHRPLMGEGRAPERGDIESAIQLSNDVARLLAGLLGFAGLARLLRRRG